MIQGLGMLQAVPKKESGKETRGAIERPGVRLYAAESFSNPVFVCDKKSAFLIVTLLYFVLASFLAIDCSSNLCVLISCFDSDGRVSC